MQKIVSTRKVVRPSQHRLSLREGYKLKKLIDEKKRRETDMVIAESYANLMMEALSKEDLQRATNTIKKLQVVNKAAGKAGMVALQAAVKKAADDVNKFMGGGLVAALKKGISDLAAKFGGKPGENPLIKSLTFLNCIESTAAALPDILANNIENYDPKDAKASPFEQAGDDDKVKKLLIDTITKSLRPDGAFNKIISLFSSGGGIPYVDNVKILVKNIVDAPAADLSAFIEACGSGPMTDDVEKTVTQMVQASGGEGGGSTAGAAAGGGAVPARGAVITGVEQLAATVAAGNAQQKKGDVAAAVDDAKKNPKAITDKFIDFVAQKSKQDKDKVVKPIIQALVAQKLLHANVQLEGVRSRSANSLVLTMTDVRHAAIALLLAEGSTDRWVSNLLTEKEESPEDRSSRRRGKASPAEPQGQQPPAKKDEPKQGDTRIATPEEVQNIKTPASPSKNRAPEYFKSFAEDIGKRLEQQFKNLSVMTRNIAQTDEVRKLDTDILKKVGQIKKLRADILKKTTDISDDDVKNLQNASKELDKFSDEVKAKLDEIKNASAERVKSAGGPQVDAAKDKVEASADQLVSTGDEVAKSNPNLESMKATVASLKSDFEKTVGEISKLSSSSLKDMLMTAITRNRGDIEKMFATLEKDENLTPENIQKVVDKLAAMSSDGINIEPSKIAGGDAAEYAKYLLMVDASSKKMISDLNKTIANLKLNIPTDETMELYQTNTAALSKISDNFKLDFQKIQGFIKAKDEAGLGTYLSTNVKSEEDFKKAIEDEQKKAEDAKAESAKLADSLRNNAAAVKLFAQSLGIKDDKKIQGLIKLSSNPEAFQGALQSLMVKEPEKVQAAAEKAGVAGGQSPAAMPQNDKVKKVIEKIQGSLKDIGPDSIAAVLDAIPDFFLAEMFLKNRFGIVL